MKYKESNVDLVITNTSSSSTLAIIFRPIPSTSSGKRYISTSSIQVASSQPTLWMIIIIFINSDPKIFFHLFFHMSLIGLNISFNQHQVILWSSTLICHLKSYELQTPKDFLFTPILHDRLFD